MLNQIFLAFIPMRDDDSAMPPASQTVAIQSRGLTPCDEDDLFEPAARNQVFAVSLENTSRAKK